MAYRRALILSGGGFKGMFQVGALDALVTEQVIPDLNFDIIAGISAGALNGSMVACQQFDKLKELWFRILTEGRDFIYTSDFITETGHIHLDVDKMKNRFLPNYKLKVGFLQLLKMLFSDNQKQKFIDQQITNIANQLRVTTRDFRGIADNAPLIEHLKQHVSRDRIPANTWFTTGFVSLNNGVYHGPTHDQYLDDDNFIKGIVASTDMPIVWEPIKEIQLQNQTVYELMDGGLRNSSPIGDVIRIANEKFDPNDDWHFLIINNNSGVFEDNASYYGLGNIALKSLTEITMAEIFTNDINDFVKTNYFVQQAQQAGIALHNTSGRALKYIDFDIIQPQREELGKLMDTRPEVLQMRYDTGYQMAVEHFANPKNPLPQFRVEQPTIKPKNKRKYVRKKKNN